uniref:F-box associated domain-containing protein n=1 Tax=Triticum aestivum TaxID=4565 RepID=A0A3B6SN00_WHEAT
MAQCRTKPMAFLYSSTSGQWQAIASEDWSNLLGCVKPVYLESRLFQACGQAYGCLYWKMRGPEFGLKNYPREVMLVLHTTRMKFSVADLPAGRRWRGGGFGIVDAGEGKLGLITHSNDGTLGYIVRQNTDMNEWQIEKIITLAEGDHTTIHVTERYLLVLRSDVRIDFMTFQVGRLYEKSECFSLVVNTFKLERVCEKRNVSCGPIYTNFPPSLSSRTV